MPVDKTTISGVSGDKYDRTYTIQTITILIDGRNNLPSIFYSVLGTRNNLVVKVRYRLGSRNC